MILNFLPPFFLLKIMSLCINKRTIMSLCPVPKIMGKNWVIEAPMDWQGRTRPIFEYEISILATIGAFAQLMCLLFFFFYLFCLFIEVLFHLYFCLFSFFFLFDFSFICRSTFFEFVQSFLVGNLSCIYSNFVNAILGLWSLTSWKIEKSD